jgi:hypothetical protein
MLRNVSLSPNSSGYEPVARSGLGTRSKECTEHDPPLASNKPIRAIPAIPAIRDRPRTRSRIGVRDRGVWGGPPPSLFRTTFTPIDKRERT